VRTSPGDDGNGALEAGGDAREVRREAAIGAACILDADNEEAVPLERLSGDGLVGLCLLRRAMTLALSRFSSFAAASGAATASTALSASSCCSSARSNSFEGPS